MSRRPDSGFVDDSPRRRTTTERIPAAIPEQPENPVAASDNPDVLQPVAHPAPAQPPVGIPQLVPVPVVPQPGAAPPVDDFGDLDLLLGGAGADEADDSDDNASQHSDPPGSPPGSPPSSNGDSDGSDSDDNMADPPAVNLLKSQFQIPKYSGRVKGSVFQGENAQWTELYTIQEWCRRVSTIKSAAGWQDDRTADYAKLAIIQNEPAGIWLQVQQEVANPGLDTWGTLKDLMEAEFRVWTSANDKVDILRSFVQTKGELSHQFLNRVRLGYQKFLEDMVVPAPPADEGEPAKAHRLRVIKAIQDYHLQSFFCLGLHDYLLSDITKNGAITIEDMAKTARTSEQASLQKKNRHTISEIASRVQTENGKNEEEVLSAQEETAVAAVLRRMRSGASNPGRGKTNKPTKKAPGTVKCYFCGVANHYANECNKRKADRAAGNWRAAIGDTPMSKAQFEATRDRLQKRVNAVTSDNFSEEEMYEAFVGAPKN